MPYVSQEKGDRHVKYGAHRLKGIAAVGATLPGQRGPFGVRGRDDEPAGGEREPRELGEIFGVGRLPARAELR